MAASSRRATAAASGVRRIRGGRTRLTDAGTIAGKHGPATMPAGNQLLPSARQPKLSAAICAAIGFDAYPVTYIAAVTQMDW